MASKQVPADEPPVDPAAGTETPASEADLYADDSPELEIDGEPFLIGPMSLQQSFRYQALLTRAAARLTPPAALPNDADPKQRAAHADRLTALEDARAEAFLGLFAPDDMVRLVALALSSRDRAITPSWVEAHCTMEQVEHVLGVWATANATTLSGYFQGKGLRATAAFARTLMGTLPPPNGRATR